MGIPLVSVGGFLQRVAQNASWGALRGLLIGALLCLVALLLRVVRGPHFLDTYGIGLGALLLSYLGGGAGAGAIAGLGRPVLRWRAGAIAVGVPGGICAFGALFLGWKGPVSHWGHANIFAVLFLGVVGGAWMGNALWENLVEPTIRPTPLPPGPPTPRPPLGLWHP
jgi:hypothetical protein